MTDGKIRTPCIGVCSTGLGDTVCRGCKRFSHEVVNWNSYSIAERSRIDQRLNELLALCVRNKVHVWDAELLRRQLEALVIAFNQHHDPHCWVVPLLRAGASQIRDLSRFGLELELSWRDAPLTQIRDAIDADYYALSCAHYERYIRPPVAQLLNQESAL